MGQLAGGIAHEFNNILTSMIGFAELTALHPNNPELVDQNMDIVVRQGHRAAHLVRQILDFSRKSILEKTPLELASFLRETVALLKHTTPENIHISLKIEPNPAGYRIHADRARIQQALTNLVINGREAMPTGGTLQIKLSSLTLLPGAESPVPEMQPGEWIVLSVSDTGTGISPEVLPHIFEPFFTTKEVGEGSGLGLAQVYGIVKQHGGDVQVDSRLGRGSIFTLFFPNLPTPQDSVPPGRRLEIPYGHGETLLLVEDTPIVMEVAQAMLERLSYQVLPASNEREALETYDHRQADIALVLADVTTLELNGLILVQALQKINPAVKIIALTEHPENAARKPLLNRGVLNWLLKPLSFEQLAQVVNQSIQR